MDSQRKAVCKLRQIYKKIVNWTTRYNEGLCQLCHMTSIQMTKNRESINDKLTRHHTNMTHTYTPLQIRSRNDWRTAPNTFILRDRDTFTPADCGRAINQVHRPKVRSGAEYSSPGCMRLIDKTRPGWGYFFFFLF